MRAKVFQYKVVCNRVFESRHMGKKFLSKSCFLVLLWLMMMRTIIQ